MKKCNLRFEFKSILDFYKAFPNEKACIRFLEKELWGKKVVSPFDPTSKVYKREDGKYRCKNTGKNFNVRKGTMFEGSKLPLRTWFMAIYLLTCHSKGISALQLSKELNITHKTACFLGHRIREAYTNTIPKRLHGVVEMDETYVGGKNQNRHWDKKVKQSRGRCTIDKVPVLGMIERNGSAVCKVVLDTSIEQLTPHILRTVHIKSTIMVDEWPGYNKVKRWYSYKQVDHKNKVYAIGDAYTNTIEQFWSNYCKRPIISTYNHIGRKHLQRYFDEFCFRHNHSKVSISESFRAVIQNCKKRLTYKELVYGNKAQERRTYAQAV